MAGGMMQLVAVGAQDAFLTGDPKVTFFQAVYKKHTNFALENIQQTVNGSAASNSRISVTIARNGDLIGEMYMKLKLVSDITTDGDMGCWVAERAIADIELSIGGQRIDKHYQRWWRLYSELYLDEAKKTNYGKLTSSATGKQGDAVYLPLLFFFNRNAGLYLPLIALQYHEVRLDFDLSSQYGDYFKSSPEIWGQYVYLDKEERIRFAQKPHQYLIEQVQHTGTDSMQQQIRLAYNHPTKLIAWCITPDSTSSNAHLWNLTTGYQNYGITYSSGAASNIYLECNALAAAKQVTGNVASHSMSYATGAPLLLSNGNSGKSVNFSEENVGPLTSNKVLFKLVLNGQDRFKEQDGKFFNQMQPMWHMPGNPMPGVYMYSFALKPGEHQPTGTCNFSRIDNSQVQYLVNGGTLPIGVQDMYAVNYNILRIQNGLGGIAFSN
jgi:hypothetical protein